ncbi:hypothetical protein CAFE_28230 [Caprobacter fermentans]|uniref:Secreted protein n=1 Tax=Caproicibacter fermentans TaxID=2576756 RepID=A0A6N8I243_9FIRM|nr:hypothetical protein [Caproicibacter fermentans]MVB12092.1 hypothetical protein [Caproicibacter fermentans]
MKRFVSVILSLVLAVSMSLPAFAANQSAVGNSSNQIHLDYVNISALNAGLSINSSGKANCTGSATLYNRSNTVVLSVQLQRYANGGWSNVKGWSISARGNTPARIVNSYYVSSGKYRVSCTAKVYSASGALLETQTAYSSTATY